MKPRFSRLNREKGASGVVMYVGILLELESVLAIEVEGMTVYATVCTRIDWIVMI